MIDSYGHTPELLLRAQRLVRARLHLNRRLGGTQLGLELANRGGGRGRGGRQRRHRVGRRRGERHGGRSRGERGGGVVGLGAGLLLLLHLRADIRRATQLDTKISVEMGFCIFLDI